MSCEENKRCVTCEKWIGACTYCLKLMGAPVAPTLIMIPTPETFKSTQNKRSYVDKFFSKLNEYLAPIKLPCSPTLSLVY